jgi:hypothetical protein
MQQGVRLQITGTDSLLICRLSKCYKSAPACCCDIPRHDGPQTTIMALTSSRSSLRQDSNLRRPTATWLLSCLAGVAIRRRVPCPESAHSARPYGPYRPKHPLGLPQPAMRNEYAHLPSLFLPVSLSHFKGVKDALKEWIR